MKIEKICIHNYKGIKELVLNPKSNSVVIFGENGIGKSSILNAIAIIYSGIVKAAMPKNKPISFLEQDISFGESLSSVNLKVNIQGEELEYEKAIERKTKRIIEDKNNKAKIIDKLKDLIESPEENAPIFVNYGVHRAVFHIPLRIRNGHNTFDKSVAFENCVSPVTDFKTFFEWYRNQEDIENEMARENGECRDVSLACVQEAIYKFLPEIRQLKVRRKPKLQMVVTKNNKTIEIGQLSDGEKSLLALVGDIARRLAIANPNLEQPLQGEGVVLIDEVELHLHPKWQRIIISNLRKTFPNIQFIVTTHSPQVLGELENTAVYKLTNSQGKIEVNCVNKIYGMDSNYILEQFMDTDKENRNIKDKIANMYILLQDGKFNEAENIKNELKLVLGSKHSDVVKAEVLLRRKKGC